MNFFKKIGIFFLSFLTAFFSGVLISDTNNLKVENYIIRNPRIKRPVRFVYLTDLHGHEFGKDNIRLIRKIDEIKPDFIVIGGDFITDKLVLKLEAMEKFVELMAKKYRLYYCIGNHEAHLKWENKAGEGAYENLKKRLTEYGAVVLDNKSEKLPSSNVCLYGLSLEERFYNKKKIFCLSKNHIENLTGMGGETTYNVLLAHTPEYFDAYKNTAANLVLSGHMHGGIMRLPYGYGAVNPRFRCFAGKCWGVLKENRVRLIISRGLAMHTIPVRLFNPAEISVITLKGNKK